MSTFATPSTSSPPTASSPLPTPPAAAAETHPAAPGAALSGSISPTASTSAQKKRKLPGDAPTRKYTRSSDFLAQLAIFLVLDAEQPTESVAAAAGVSKGALYKRVQRERKARRLHAASSPAAAAELAREAEMRRQFVEQFFSSTTGSQRYNARLHGVHVTDEEHTSS